MNYDKIFLSRSLTMEEPCKFWMKEAKFMMIRRCYARISIGNYLGLDKDLKSYLIYIFKI